MVNRYRTKPCEILAIQYLGTEDSFEEVREFCDNDSLFMKNNQVIIKTLEGDMIASPGDYIIKGLRGEYYPCKPDVFEKKYELIFA